MGEAKKQNVKKKFLYFIIIHESFHLIKEFPFYNILDLVKLGEKNLVDIEIYNHLFWKHSFTLIQKFCYKFWNYEKATW